MTQPLIEYLIMKFGGQTEMGRALGVDQSAVAKWKKRGAIPAQQWEGILAAARARHIRLKPGDFFAEPR